MKITKLFKNVLFLCLVVFFTGCSTSSLPLPLDYNATNYDTFMNETVEKMSSKMAMLKKQQEVVLVTDFVNVDDLKNQSKLGFLLSSALKDTLTSQYDITVREVKLSQHFKFGNEGFKLLTKKHEEIDPNIEPETMYAIVGTYTVTSKQLIVFTQIMDIYSGHILGSSTNRTRLTEEIMQLDKRPERRRVNVYSPMRL